MLVAQALARSRTVIQSLTVIVIVTLASLAISIAPSTNWFQNACKWWLICSSIFVFLLAFRNKICNRRGVWLVCANSFTDQNWNVGRTAALCGYVLFETHAHWHNNPRRCTLPNISMYIPMWLSENNYWFRNCATKLHIWLDFDFDIQQLTSLA